MVSTEASRGELLRALARLIDPPDPGLAPVVAALGLPRVPRAAEHGELFTFQLHPYASVHLGPEGQLGGVARDRVAGFLRAVGVDPPAACDHLGVLLAAAAELHDLEAAGAAPARRVRTALLHEHLLPWVPRLLVRVGELGAEPYRVWADRLSDVLDAEVAALGPPAQLAVHLREAPELPDPREDDAGAKRFVTYLLAPVRSGLILARADLARAAGQLGLGLRVGERAFTLEALLGQDAAGTLRWLADEARHQHTTVPVLPGDDDLTAAFWRARLDGSAGLLDALAAAA